jgi:DNA-binding IclR family transcriptional regulator
VGNEQSISGRGVVAVLAKENKKTIVSSEGPEDVSSTVSQAATAASGRRRIQSADKASEVLLALVEAGTATPLRDLARALGMTNSLTHRYLASLMASGLAIQHEDTGLYDLGPTAVRIGAAALARVDHLRLAAEAMPHLVSVVGLPALLCVLGDRGPTIVRWERSYVPFITTLAAGSTFELTNSASGRALLAFTPEQLRDELIKRAITKNGERAPTDLMDQLATVRARRFDEAESVLIPGLFAMSAPILDVQNEAVACITLIGPNARVLDIKDQAIKHLVATADSISRTCGSNLT